MNQQDKNELNLKLAKFAELPRVGLERIAGSLKFRIDFTGSLDALFAHVVPVLQEKGMGYDLFGWSKGRHKAVITGLTEEWAPVVVEAVAGTPALALATAIVHVIYAMESEKMKGESNV